MKYAFTLLLLSIFSVTLAQKKPTITIDKNSLNEQEIRNINPNFLDTTYSVIEDGMLKMRVHVAKNLDTAYIEKPTNGSLQMVVTRKKQELPRKENNPSHEKGDTIYMEDPRNGEIINIIID